MHSFGSSVGLDWVPYSEQGDSRLFLNAADSSNPKPALRTVNCSGRTFLPNIQSGSSRTSASVGEPMDSRGIFSSQWLPLAFRNVSVSADSSHWARGARRLQSRVVESSSVCQAREHPGWAPTTIVEEGMCPWIGLLSLQSDLTNPPTAMELPLTMEPLSSLDSHLACL